MGWLYRGITRSQLHEGLQELFRITKTPLPTKELSHAIFDAITGSSGGAISTSPVLALQQFENAFWLRESRGRRRLRGRSASPDTRRPSAGPSERARASGSLSSQITKPYLSQPMGRGGQGDRSRELQVQGHKEAWAGPAPATSRGRAAAFDMRSAAVSGLSTRPASAAGHTQATSREAGRSAPGSLLSAGMSSPLFFRLIVLRMRHACRRGCEKLTLRARTLNVPAPALVCSFARTHAQHTHLHAHAVKQISGKANEIEERCLALGGHARIKRSQLTTGGLLHPSCSAATRSPHGVT